MTNTPQPAFGGPLTQEGGTPWWWQLHDADGAVVEGDGRQDFPTRSDAESWIGEVYPELAEEGVASVTLFEGEREVYGPMSLSSP